VQQRKMKLMRLPALWKPKARLVMSQGAVVCVQGRWPRGSCAENPSTPRSRSCPVVGAEESPETPTPDHRTATVRRGGALDQSVLQALMVPFAVIVRNELRKPIAADGARQAARSDRGIRS
jgi:hypothetical protein